MQLLEGSRHRILAPDGGQAQAHLRHIRAQKSCKGLPPPGIVLIQPLKIFLECKSNLPVVPSSGHNLSHRLHDRIDGPVERAPRGQHRIIPVGHHRRRGRLAILHRNLRRHGLNGSQLTIATVWHQHSGRADGRIKHLHQALLAANIQVRQDLSHRISQLFSFGRFRYRHRPRVRRRCHLHLCIAGSSVGIQEVTAHIDDDMVPPLHDQPCLLRHLCNLHGFQILFGCRRQKSRHILRLNHDSHSLLGFRDGKLRSIQSRILLRNLIQMDKQAWRQLSNRNADASSSKIVADLNQTAHLRVAE